MEARQRIRTIFSHAEKAFVAEKAGKWKANLQFIIDGAEDHTIVVDSGAVAVHIGRVGKATCEIRVAADALADIVEGKISGQRAFVSGKIKISRLREMMKFSKTFDFQRGREAASETTSAADDEKSDEFAPYFENLPRVFDSGAVGSWRGKIAFDIAGSKGWTLHIDADGCSVTRGIERRPTSTIIATPEVVEEVFRGQTTFSQASMDKRIKVENTIALFKLRQLFDWNHESWQRFT